MNNLVSIFSTAPIVKCCKVSYPCWIGDDSEDQNIESSGREILCPSVLELYNVDKNTIHCTTFHNCRDVIGRETDASRPLADSSIPWGGWRVSRFADMGRDGAKQVDRLWRGFELDLIEQLLVGPRIIRG